MQLRFFKVHYQIPPEKKWLWPWARGAPKNLVFPFNISATVKASDFKVAIQLGFAKTHHKITPKGKRGRGLGLGKLPKILGFPYNIFATALSCGLPSTIIKLHAEEKGRGPRLSSPNVGGYPSLFTYWLKLATSHLIHSLGLPRPIIKITHRRKNGRDPGLDKLPNILGFLFNIYATSNLACSWGLPRPTIKLAWLWAREAPKYLGSF